MAKAKFKRIIRPATAAEKQRHAEIRAKVMEEFPPVEVAGSKHARRNSQVPKKAVVQ